MSLGKLLKFKSVEVIDASAERLSDRRGFPKNPVKFFGISESNPVKFFGISEVEIPSVSENKPKKSASQKRKRKPYFPPPKSTQVLERKDVLEEKHQEIETQEKPQKIETQTIDSESVRTSDELPKQDVPPTVMLIEDDRVISNFLQHLLKRRGFLTQHASDGKKAAEMLEEITPPNLIIVDLMLPFIDGFELIQKIRNKDEWAEIPIIVVTAKTQEQDITRAFEMGANDYLVKPFRTQELIARVKRFVTEK